MKKKDIIKLVKDTIKEGAYGSATLTTQGPPNSAGGKKTRLPGVWEREKLKQQPFPGVGERNIDEEGESWGLDIRQLADSFTFEELEQLYNDNKITKEDLNGATSYLQAWIDQHPTYLPQRDLTEPKRQRIRDKYLSESPMFGKKEPFTKDYGSKISPEEFKSKMPVGKTVLYGGTRYKVLKNTGYVLTLLSPSKKTLKVNLNQFISQGAIKEKDMKKPIKEKNQQLNEVEPITTIGMLAGILATGGFVLEPEAMKDVWDFIRQKDRSKGDQYRWDKKDRSKNEVAKKKLYKVIPQKGGEKYMPFASDVDAKSAEQYQNISKIEPLEEGDLQNEITSLMQQMGVDDSAWKPKAHLLDKSIAQTSAWKEKLEALAEWIRSVAGGVKDVDENQQLNMMEDYIKERGDSNLMEHMDKYRKRAQLMESAWKDISPMFKQEKNDDEIVQHYVTKGIAPEHVSELPRLVKSFRDKWNNLQKIETELKILNQEAEQLKQSSQPVVSGMEGGMDGMEEDKQLASGLFSK